MIPIKNRAFIKFSVLLKLFSIQVHRDCMHAQLLSSVNSLWPCGLQPSRLPQAMVVSRQVYWNEFPFHSSDLPISGQTISPASHTIGRQFLYHRQPGKPNQGDDITLMKGKCRVKKWDSLFTYKNKCPLYLTRKNPL